MYQIISAPKPNSTPAVPGAGIDAGKEEKVLNDLGVVERHRAAPGARLPFGHGEVVVDNDGQGHRLIIN